MKRTIWEIFKKAKADILKYIDPTPKGSKTLVDPDDYYGNNISQTWLGFLNDALARNSEDKVKYQDYDLMDAEIPEIATALDVMSDYVIYPDTTNKTRIFQIRTKDEKSNEEISKKIELIDEVTKFKTEFWSMIRTLCKYGDDFEEILRNTNKEVVGLKNIINESVIVQIKNGIIDPVYPIEQYNSSQEPIAKLKKEEVVHLCLNSDRKRYYLYGKGCSRIEKARLIYRQLRLMEEGVIISRLSRSNQNYAIVLDVGDSDPFEALEYMEKYRNRLNKRKYIDTNTGRMSFKYNPLSIVEDIIVPTRAGSSGNVIPLSANTSIKDIEDVYYFQNKMIYATGVPKILIGKEEDVNSKATSETQYISFLRMIRRIQKLVEGDILEFYKNALISLGVKEPIKLYIEWPLAGTIDEERKWRIELIKTQISAMLSQDMSLVDDYWIYQNMMGMSDDEIEILIDRMDEAEAKNMAEVEDAMAGAEYEPEETPTSPVPPKKNGKPAKGEVPQKADKEEVMKFYKNKLGDEKFEKFSTMIKLVESNPDLRQSLDSFIKLTKEKASD